MKPSKGVTMREETVARPQRKTFPYSPSIPQRAAECWHRRSSVGRALGSWENYVYDATIERRRVVLRLTEARHRTVDQVASELTWVAFLSSAGLPVARPLLSSRGSLVESLEEHGRVVAACVFPHIAGVQPSPARCRQLGRPFFHALGTLIGRLHVASLHYAQRESIGTSRPSLLCDELIENAGRYSKNAPASMVAAIDAAAGWLHAQSADAEFGLIHADIHGRNILLHGSDLSLIDFDDCCFGWFAYDLAVALNWAYPPGHRQRGRALGWLIGGYATARTVSDDVPRQIDGFIRVRLAQDYLLTMSRLADPDYPGDWLLARATMLERRLRAASVDTAGGLSEWMP